MSESIVVVEVEEDLCTCKYEEDNTDENSFYQNHGCCQACFFL